MHEAALTLTGLIAFAFVAVILFLQRYFSRHGRRGDGSFIKLIDDLEGQPMVVGIEPAHLSSPEDATVPFIPPDLTVAVAHLLSSEDVTLWASDVNVIDTSLSLSFKAKLIITGASLVKPGASWESCEASENFINELLDKCAEIWPGYCAIFRPAAEELSELDFFDEYPKRKSEALGLWAECSFEAKMMMEVLKKEDCCHHDCYDFA